MDGQTDAADALGASLCWTGWLGCQKGAERLGVQGSCARGNNNGFACSVLKYAPGSNIFPGLMALQALEHDWEVCCLAGGWVLPNTFFTGLFPVAPASTMGLGVSIWQTCRSLLPQPGIPAAPGTLAPFFKQLLSLGEGQQQGTISGWLFCAGAGEWPAAGVMPT